MSDDTQNEMWEDENEDSFMPVEEEEEELEPEDK